MKTFFQSKKILKQSKRLYTFLHKFFPKESKFYKYLNEIYPVCLGWTCEEIITTYSNKISNKIKNT